MKVDHLIYSLMTVFVLYCCWDQIQDVGNGEYWLENTLL